MKAGLRLSKAEFSHLTTLSKGPIKAGTMGKLGREGPIDMMITLANLGLATWVWDRRKPWMKVFTISPAGQTILQTPAVTEPPPPPKEYPTLRQERNRKAAKRRRAYERHLNKLAVEREMKKT